MAIFNKRPVVGSNANNMQSRSTAISPVQQRALDAGRTIPKQVLPGPSKQQIAAARANDAAAQQELKLKKALDILTRSLSVQFTGTNTGSPPSGNNLNFN